MFTKFVFIISQTLLILFLIISGCKDSDNPIDGGEPPCLDCPIDFRLTDFEPAWSPDGRTIAYVHGDTINGQTGIWLIDTSGNNKHVIYASAGAYSPTWSPDGQWIAFSDGAQIFKMKLNGDSLTQLTVAGRNFFPAWSPDGQWIAYNRSICEGPNTCGIWLMTSSGTNHRFLADYGNYPEWHPEGSLLIYIGWFDSTRGGIVLFDRLTRSRTLLLDAKGSIINYLKYSPDGLKITFTLQLTPGIALTQIWIMNSDGSNLHQLTSTQGYSCDWSPTGEWIVYTDSRAVSGRLWLIRSDGSGNHQLTF
jgi:TolB protein